MSIACFCGHNYTDSGDMSECPNCGSIIIAVATVPKHEQHLMELALARVIGEHERPTYGPGWPD